MSKRETGISRDGGTIDESTLSLESLISALPAVASRHGIPPVSHRPHPTSGATGLVFVLDRVVVKVPKADPVAVAALRTDVTVSQIALAHGIRAAPLIAFDERCDLLPVPFAIFARIPGQTLEELGRNASNTAASWEATGRQLARVHAIAPGDPVLDALRQFAQTQDVDPLPWVEELSAAGAMTPSSASTCQALIAQLAETARAGGLVAFVTAISTRRMWSLPRMTRSRSRCSIGRVLAGLTRSGILSACRCRRYRRSCAVTGRTRHCPMTAQPKRG